MDRSPLPAGFGVGLGETLFEHLRSTFYEVLGLFETQTGNFAYDFDDLNLLGTDGGELYVERGFLFSGSGGSSGGSGGYGNGSSGGYAKALFQLFNNFGGLKKSEVANSIDQSGLIHDFLQKFYN